MKALIQRVSSGSVIVENKTVGSIQKGLVVLLEIFTGDVETVLAIFIASQKGWSIAISIYILKISWIKVFDRL